MENLAWKSQGFDHCMIAVTLSVGATILSSSSILLPSQMLGLSTNEGKREFGVGFILDRNTARSFLGFNPISDRIISLRLHGHPFNISIVQVYAPTSTASDEAMENFYGQLQDVLDKIPSKDMLIILGGWNAKVGKSDIKSRSIGKFGLGERNDRGDSLEEFCQANDLIVGNTLFQQHPRRLWTWRSPGGNVKNQIDYILLKRRWCSSLFSVRTRPGADCGSDHQLLVARMKLKLKAKKRVTPPVRFDVDKIPEQYTVSVGNRFEALLRTDEEELSPNELWEEMKEAVLSAAEENIIKKKKKSSPGYLRRQ
ncbi:craniofacial development protein 2-like [Amphiura filiformis]|uniref:craniofacial development protein 2-like n=1 Tax=Amphiura filiformis TaxID=82378 RepID=UPI003B21A1D5